MKNLQKYLSLILVVMLSQILSVTAVFAAGEVLAELNTETKKITIPTSNQDQTLNAQLKLSLTKIQNQGFNISDAKVKVTTKYRVGDQQGTDPSAAEYTFKSNTDIFNVPISITVPRGTTPNTYKIRVVSSITNSTNDDKAKVYDTEESYVIVEVVNADIIPPTATVAYSTTSPTNQNVIATLVDPSEPITVTNNGGSTSYTFTENGSFTFEFVDSAGNPNTATATVNNIDKQNPEAIISYSNVDPTNQNVIATITPNEEVTVTNNSGSFSKEFLTNGSFTFEFKDVAGNTGSVTATVGNIDKENPTARIDYSTTNPTNQDVTATLFPSEKVTVINNGGSKEYTFSSNNSFIFEFMDLAGNYGTATATVENIDKNNPTAKVEYSTTNPTNQSVIVSLVNESENITVTNNGGSKTYTFTNNGTFTFEFVDAAGNQGYAEAIVENIDKEAPTATVSYSTEDPTNQDVIAILNPNEPVTVTNNGGSTSYTFDHNGTFTFEFVDAAGNTGVATATVNNIDKVPPTAEVEYSTIGPTNQDVIATLVNPNEQITLISAGGYTHTFTENGTFTFVFKDRAGNIGQAKAKVENIDKEPPTATVSYSTENLTNGDVIATILPSEDVTATNNNGSLSYTFIENGSFTFEFMDAAGNTGEVTATVKNIDKTPPTATVSYSSTTPTNQDVIATITPSETVTVTNNEGSLKYKFENNGSFTFEFTDLAGNIGSTTATVNNIDKIAPTATIEYSTTGPTNQNVTATITPSEIVTITNNGGSHSHTFENNGTFKFEFMDAAGNTGEVTATVNNIDKVSPTADIEYSTTNPTNQNVVVNLVNLSESIYVTNNNGSLSHTFTNNGSYTFEFVDLAGNTGSATATVNNIDKIAPTATVSYSTTNLTNQDVIATITPSEAVTVTNNGGSLSHIFEDNNSFTFEFVDTAGNTGSITATVSNIDKVQPELTINSPTGKTYYLNEPVLADWSASDTSGIVTEVSTVEKGKLIDTNSPGVHSFTVIVTDTAGNKTTKTVQYNVVYKSSGILQPINLNKTSLFKLGSTVPVKFQLFDVNSKYISDATATISVAKITDNVIGSYVEAASTSNATSGNLFRYDSIDNQYIFNLSTKNGYTAGTYSILIEIKKGTEVIQVETATISLK